MGIYGIWAAHLFPSIFQRKFHGPAPGTSPQGRVVLPAALRDLKPQDLAVLVARHRMEPVVRDGMPMKAMG